MRITSDLVALAQVTVAATGQPHNATWIFGKLVEVSELRSKLNHRWEKCLSRNSCNGCDSMVERKVKSCRLSVAAIKYSWVEPTTHCVDVWRLDNAKVAHTNNPTCCGYGRGGCIGTRFVSGRTLSISTLLFCFRKCLSYIINHICEQVMVCRHLMLIYWIIWYCYWACFRFGYSSRSAS